MIREIIACKDACFLPREGHLVSYFFNYSLIEDCFVKEDQRVADNETEEHAIEDAHSRVEKEEKHSTQHDNTAHEVCFASFRSSLATAEDRHLIIH